MVHRGDRPIASRGDVIPVAGSASTFTYAVIVAGAFYVEAAD